MDKYERGRIAEEFFRNGCTCAQSMLCAFEDVTGFDRSMSLKISSSFGGGFGHLREVCGAFSGACMIFGMVCGFDEMGNLEKKTAHYELVQEMGRRFKEKNGSLICRELLDGFIAAAPSVAPEKRTTEYYDTRPCPAIVNKAAVILQEMLDEYAPKQTDTEEK